ncbi:helix-turn-helix domain-containing protein [Capnocytophaga catalasegens]|uniref:Transcriptional regulator n=1 Tax=Capnocytophaga catalasegens TaxID=1004260 RepID=A0AAV5AXH0_9FLAO|nr:helix-turn-helix transcriptional regulator [Capnocytophaga catalasegens]GIZ14763.1 transcriptional regulator [Capnocytophaga catalasegens]GJM50611.1 transcriptional regulator [Capnocytophaga catalasegens]GJM53558.1 transcriptional regulator [Capnocytophaga catalasegens]
MVNTTAFTERLLKVMNYYELSASALADELGIQRSGISHLLSERNKPSLDFVLKMNEKFPEVTIEWLTQGKGNFPPIDSVDSSLQKTENKNIKQDTFDLFSYATLNEKNKLDILKILEKSEEHLSNKKIQKIIFFYDDNSFEIYEN